MSEPTIEELNAIVKRKWARDAVSANLVFFRTPRLLLIYRPNDVAIVAYQTHASEYGHFDTFESGLNPQYGRVQIQDRDWRIALAIMKDVINVIALARNR